MQNWRERWLPSRKGELTILGGDVGGLFLLTVGVQKKIYHKVDLTHSAPRFFYFYPYLHLKELCPLFYSASSLPTKLALTAYFTCYLNSWQNSMSFPIFKPTPTPGRLEYMGREREWGIKVPVVPSHSMRYA
jgi:hypothetical protein